MASSWVFRPRSPIGRAMGRIFPATAARSGIAKVAAFGTNPGELRMLGYAPARLAAGRPLVVVLHGCRQDAATFAADAGWIALADKFRLALLIPEQTYENNRGRCFNWYQSDDVHRGRGETMSIRQMIRNAVGRFGSDPRRIFVAGFSAGGAMTAALLAAYPAVFAAGGVAAGMPVGSGKTPIMAMLQMQRADYSWQTRTTLAGHVRAATRSGSRKTWPRLSIWQGARDRTVAPGNAEALAAQWSELHGYGSVPTIDDVVASGVRRRAWGRSGRPPSVEMWTIASIGHGFPVDPRTPASGHVGPWVVDAGLCAAQLMAAFWGLDRPGK